MRGPVRELQASGTLRVAAACALVGAIAAPATALNMTLGDVAVRALSAYGFTSGNNSELSFDGGTTDELYQMWGYLGNATGTVDVTGTNFNIQSNISQTSPGVAQSSLILDNNGAAALGMGAGDIRIDYTFTLVDDTSPQDLDGFLWDVSVTNNSTSDYDLVFYQYLDLDLDGAGDFGDDLADANTSRILVTDSDSSRSFIWRASNGGSADHFEVQAYASVRTLLDNMGPATDLSDTAASFGPDDFTGAFQYDFYLPAGATFVLASGQVSVPEPSSLLLAVTGLVGLSLVSRRSRRRALATRGG